MRTARRMILTLGIAAACLALPIAASAQGKLELKDGSAKVAATLTAKDAKDAKSNQPSKVYTIDLKGGQTYQIDMVKFGKKSQIDPYLRLEDPTGKQLAEDDDGGGFPNARITFTCTADGNYRIIATSFAGSVGPFSLTVKQTVAGKAPELAKGTEIKLNNGMIEVNSQLANTDGKDTARKNSLCKVYTIKLDANKTYQIDMVSKKLDSFLRLEDDKGKELANDDDSGGFPNARIVFNSPAEGTYRIIATSVFGGTGDFTLTVKENTK